MITKTSLLHSSVQQRLNAAMQDAINHPNCPVAVFNRYNQPALICHWLTGEIAYRRLGRSSGFYWWEYASMRNVTETVTDSLRAQLRRAA